MDPQGARAPGCHAGQTDGMNVDGDASRAPGQGSKGVKAALRRELLASRAAMPDRAERDRRLERVVADWLARRPETTIGAYWPIQGEFDPLSLLGAWREADPARRVGLPVVVPGTKVLTFREWFPGCPMRDDAYGIPTPQGTDVLRPQLLAVPCLGFGPGGLRLGYGGGYYDQTLAALDPRPFTLGVGFALGFVPWLVPEPHDMTLDAIATEDGLAWQGARPMGTGA
jgi:5,10-methenyltetrahydrofolate synthetase